MTHQPYIDVVIEMFDRNYWFCAYAATDPEEMVLTNRGFERTGKPRFEKWFVRGCQVALETVKQEYLRRESDHGRESAEKEEESAAID